MMTTLTEPAADFQPGGQRLERGILIPVIRKPGHFFHWNPARFATLKLSQSH